MALKDWWSAATARGFGLFGRQPAAATAGAGDLVDLPLAPIPDLPARREAATAQFREARATAKAEGMTLSAGLALDADDYQYRRLTSGAKTQKRDLSRIQQDRMLEIAWYLWEQNPFAKRLISFMTDLILGEGVTVEAEDERIQEVIDAVWNHRINQLKTRSREFRNALALNGELIIPVEVNPVTGRPVFGFIDPAQVDRIETDPMNVLLSTYVVLKGETGKDGQRLKIVQEDPETGILEGEVFYHGVNRLPNSTRGRSDLLPLADWLDLYDQYLFAEVERLHLLSSFVWDYTVEGADQTTIDQKLKKLPNPKPGQVFGHNEKEKLEARTPDLKAADRSEAGRMLRTHIAGSYGFPLSYLGEVESNRATIEGQNDVLMKTPSSCQQDFKSFLEMIARYSIQHATKANPALFRDAQDGFKVRMPEIAAKDVSRIGQVLAQVVTAMDTAMSNRTASRQLAVVVTLAMLKHLGIEADPQEVMEAADVDAEERQAEFDERQAAAAAIAAKSGGKPPGPGGGRGNPPIPADDEDEDAA